MLERIYRKGYGNGMGKGGKVKIREERRE